MHPRATELIVALRLEPHPEGGFYRQVYRSALPVARTPDAASRTALTTIFFLLHADDVSRWHAVSSDEAWHFYEGAPLELFTADAAFTHTEKHLLGPVSPGGSSPVHVVAAGDWQAARTTGAYTLVGCTVGPGFEFADFTMLRDVPALAGTVRTRYPAVAALIGS